MTSTKPLSGSDEQSPIETISKKLIMLGEIYSQTEIKGHYARSLSVLEWYMR